MQIKTKNIFNNSIKHQVTIKKNLLLKKNKIIKYLIKDLKKKNGRCSHSGQITVRHKGNGCKKKLHITTKSLIFFGINIGQMYNSYNNNFISLNFDLKKKIYFKTNSIEKTTTGTIIASDIKKKRLIIGFQNSLKNLPSGSIISTLFSTNLKNIKYANSSGTFCQLLDNRNFYTLRLPSGKIINVNHRYHLFGTLGKINNYQHNLTYIGKAGRNRNKGIRPSVRGIAMNPVDHPHGGRTNGGCPSVTPWGKPTKGKPTVKKK